MSEASVVNGDMRIYGSLYANSLTVPSSAISDAQVASGADISASKLEHEHKHAVALLKVGEGVSATNYTNKQVIYVCNSASGGEVKDFEICASAACDGAGSAISVALQKVTSGGTPASILSSTLQITTGDSAYQIKVGTIGTTTLADGDVLLASVTVSTHGGVTNCQGLSAFLRVYESA